MKDTLAQRILNFNSNLPQSMALPNHVKPLYPFNNADVIKSTTLFYNQYYTDNHCRILILGINPGRFGAGVTGIPFTDPVQLETHCGIKNPFNKKTELSSIYIYQSIAAYGGPETFYRQFVFGSLSPIGYIRDNKNLNYYDDKELQTTLEPFIIDAIKKQIEWGCSTDVCICLGEGKNYKYLQKLNHKHHFFKQILPLPHPRFILQYRRKRLIEFLDQYQNTFITALASLKQTH